MSNVNYYNSFDLKDISNILNDTVTKYYDTTYNTKLYTTAAEYEYIWDVIYGKNVFLHGVKLLEINTTYTYEGIILDDLSKFTFKGTGKITNNDLDDIPIDVSNFKQITDTLIQFQIKDYYDPSVYDFYLRFNETK